MKSWQLYRILFLCVVQVLALAMASWAAHDGDLDGDGRVTIADALRALRITVQLVTPTDSDRLFGDVSPVVNGVATPDQVITIADALQIIRKAVGLTNWAVASIPVSDNPGSMTILPDGKKGYVALTPSNQVSVIDTDPQSLTFNSVLASIPVGFSPAGLALTPDGSRLYVTNAGGSISVIATSSDQVIATIPLQSLQTTPGGIAITPDGKRAYFTSYFGILNLLDTDPASPTYNQTSVAIQRFSNGNGNISITPDGTKAMVHWSDSNDFGPNTHSVSVLDIDPGSATFNQVNLIIFAPVPEVAGPVTNVAIPPNGTVAYSINESNRLCKIDLQTNRVLQDVVGPFVEGGSITLTPDGLTLIHSNFNSHKLTFFRAADLTLLQEVDFGTALGSYIMVTPDGTRVYIQRHSAAQGSELLVVPLQWQGLATPGQIAQTPKSNAEAEVLTLEATGAFIAPQDVYDRVVRELASIRSAYPAVSSIAALPSWHPQKMLVGLDVTGAAAVLDGSYTAWSGLNSLYGVTGIDNNLVSSIGVALLDFGGRFSVPLLAGEYAKLPHVRYAEPDILMGDGSDVCLQISGDTHSFIFDQGSGDCLSGCIDHNYWGFSVDSSGRVAALGTWQRGAIGISAPQWFQNLSSCGKWL